MFPALDFVKSLAPGLILNTPPSFVLTTLFHSPMYNGIQLNPVYPKTKQISLSGSHLYQELHRRLF